MNDVDLNRLLVTIIRQFGPFECSADELVSNYIEDYEDVGISIDFSEDGQNITISLSNVQESPDDEL